MNLNEDLRIAQDMVQGLSDLLATVLDKSIKDRDFINQQYQEIETLTLQLDRAQAKLHEYARRIQELTHELR